MCFYMAIQCIPTAVQVLSEFVYIWNKCINTVAAVTLQFVRPVNCDISTDIGIMFGLVCIILKRAFRLFYCNIQKCLGFITFCGIESWFLDTLYHMWFEDLTLLVMRIRVFWDVIPCWLAVCYWFVRGRTATIFRVAEEDCVAGIICCIM
jgi:hypothetical protein